MLNLSALSRTIPWLLLLLGCGGGEAPPSGLKYYTTCGDPVCGGHRDMGVMACTTEKEGAGCATAGQRCDPVNSCNSLLICAMSDPKQGPGGCPISRRQSKAEVRYLGPAERARYHDALRGIKLATYRYKDGAGRRHLGFIIEDLDREEQRVGVDAERDMVDLYGYTSLAVAALQEQAQQIEALQREVQDLRRQLQRSVRRPVQGARR